MQKARKQDVCELVLPLSLFFYIISGTPLQWLAFNFSTLPKWEQLLQHQENTTKRSGKGYTIIKPLHKLKQVELPKHAQTPQKFLGKIREIFVCRLRSTFCSWTCQRRLTRLWGVTSTPLFAPSWSLRSLSLPLENLSSEMGPQQRASTKGLLAVQVSWQLGAGLLPFAVRDGESELLQGSQGLWEQFGS